MFGRYMDLVLCAAKKDAHYQSLLQECVQLGEAYDRICRQLSEEEKETLERYISICENMEYRKLCLALELWSLETKQENRLE